MCSIIHICLFELKISTVIIIYLSIYDDDNDDLFIYVL